MYTYFSCALGSLPFLLFPAGATAASSRIISGQVVATADYPAIVQVQGQGTCTATLVGPRALITAAHCGATGTKVKFKTSMGETYTATLTQSPAYAPTQPKADLDLAMGLVSKDVTGVDPISVGNTTAVGQPVTILGYGCMGLNIAADGNLRRGVTHLAKYYGYAMVLEDPTPGAAICFGDSGGPGLDEAASRPLLIGVHSRGDIYDTSNDVRLDIPESRAFIVDWAAKNQVDVCGVTRECL